MSQYDQDTTASIRKFVLRTITFLILIIVLWMWGMPKYDIYKQTLQGEAEFKRAEQTRKIKVEEAKATYESSKQLAEAEIERAKGVAKANEIIGASLKNNEAYLRYLWIDGLHGNKNQQIIYVPTEANLPILEASRLNQAE